MRNKKKKIEELRNPGELQKETKSFRGRKETKQKNTAKPEKDNPNIKDGQQRYRNPSWV